MAHPALIKPFALDASASAPSAGSRPFLWGLEVYFKAIRLDGLVENFITTDSDGFKEARHTGILSPMSPIFDQEPKLAHCSVAVGRLGNIFSGLHKNWDESKAHQLRR